MKKSKILLGTLSLTAIAPIIPMVASCSCSTTDNSFTPSITKDECIESYEISKTELYKAFAIYCTCKKGYVVDSASTIVSVGNKKLTIDQDYIIYNNIIIIGSDAMTDKNVSVSIKSKDVSVVYSVQLFASTGGTLVGGLTTHEVVQGTLWKDIPNKPTPTASAGYKFVGWYRNQTLITDETPITENMEIYAWFEKSESKQCYATILSGPGGSIEMSQPIIPFKSGVKWGNIKPDDSLIKPSTSYKFVGWFLDDKQIDDETVLTDNSYIFAWFENTTTTKCDVRFVNMNGGSFQNEQASTYPTITINKGAKWSEIAAASKPVPVAKDSYKFENWYIDDVAVKDTTVISDTTYVFAYFEKSKANITIDNADHGQVLQTSVQLNVGSFNSLREGLDKCVKPDTGYVLGGWLDGENRIFDNQRVEIDKTLKPIFVEECNTYEYDETKHEAKITGRITGKEQANLMVPAYVWKNGDSTPYKVVSINEYYYSDVTALQTLCLPNTITRVPKRAFKNCSSLETLILPNSITYIGYETFYMTNFKTALNKFIFLGTREQFSNVSKDGWWCEGIKNKNCICTDGVIAFS